LGVFRNELCRRGGVQGARDFCGGGGGGLDCLMKNS